MKIKFLRQLLKVLVAASCLTGTAKGQSILVGDLENNISQYDANTGALIKADFITGIGARNFAYDGTNLYASNILNGTIGKYNALTGQAVNSTLVSGLDVPLGIAFHNGLLYVSSMNSVDANSGYISTFDAVTGSMVTYGLIGGLYNPSMLQVYNEHLYIPTASGMIGLYNLDGSVINSSFISDLVNPSGIVFADGALFVANNGNGNVSKYDALTGQLISAALINYGGNPTGIVINERGNLVVADLFGTVREYTTDGTAVHDPLFTNAPYLLVGIQFVPVPEPSTNVLLGVCAVAVTLHARRRLRLSKMTS